MTKVKKQFCLTLNLSQTGSEKGVLGILHLVGENDLGTNICRYGVCQCTQSHVRHLNPNTSSILNYIYIYSSYFIMNAIRL